MKPVKLSALPAALRTASARGGWPKGGAIVRARGRTHGKRRGEMNRTETAFADILDGLQRARQIVAWYFETMKFRIGDGAWYTPDFLILSPDGGIELADVKGPHHEEAARVRVKVAADLYPMFTWSLRTRRKGGVWTVEQFGSAPTQAPHEEEPGMAKIEKCPK